MAWLGSSDRLRSMRSPRGLSGAEKEAFVGRAERRAEKLQSDFSRLHRAQVSRLYTRNSACTSLKIVVRYSVQPRWAEVTTL